MNARTNAINTTLTTVGALILLSVLAWVVYTISQPLIPNTGEPLPQESITPAGVTDADAPTTTNRMIESVDDRGGDGGGSDDPTGKSHSE